MRFSGALSALLSLVVLAVVANEVAARRSRYLQEEQPPPPPPPTECHHWGLCKWITECCCYNFLGEVPLCDRRRRSSSRVTRRGYCPMANNLRDDPVCGSDGKTYGNPHDLAVASCNMRKGITLVHYGDCKEFEPHSPDGCE